MTLASLSSVGSLAASAMALGVQKIQAGLSFANILSSSAPQDSPTTQTAPLPADRADALQQELKSGLQRFRDSVLRRFATAGIDSTVPLLLQSDGLGGISTDGRHPDRQAIEQLFARDDQLTQAFQRLELLHAQVRAGDSRSGDEPAPATDRDPPFAVLLANDTIQIAP